MDVTSCASAAAGWPIAQEPAPIPAALLDASPTNLIVILVAGDEQSMALRRCGGTFYLSGASSWLRSPQAATMDAG
jgi:hypothetical protein